MTGREAVAAQAGVWSSVSGHDEEAGSVRITDYQRAGAAASRRLFAINPRDVAKLNIELSRL